MENCREETLGERTLLSHPWITEALL
jgi:hypothetical protein